MSKIYIEKGKKDKGNVFLKEDWDLTFLDLCGKYMRNAIKEDVFITESAIQSFFEAITKEMVKEETIKKVDKDLFDKLKSGDVNLKVSELFPLAQFLKKQLKTFFGVKFTIAFD